MITKQAFEQVIENLIDMEEKIEVLADLGLDVEELFQPLYEAVTLALGPDLAAVAVREVELTMECLDDEDEFDDEDFDEDFDDEDDDEEDEEYSCSCPFCAVCEDAYDEDEDEDEDEFDDEDEDEEEELSLLMFDPTGCFPHRFVAEYWESAYDLIASGFCVCD